MLSCRGLSVGQYVLSLLSWMSGPVRKGVGKECQAELYREREDANVRVIYLSTVNSLQCVRFDILVPFYPIYGTAMTQNETSHS